MFSRLSGYRSVDIDVMYEETEFTDDYESISRFGQACMVESGQELFRATVKGIGKKNKKKMREFGKIPTSRSEERQRSFGHVKREGNAGITRASHLLWMINKNSLIINLASVPESTI